MARHRARQVREAGLNRDLAAPAPQALSRRPWARRSFGHLRQIRADPSGRECCAICCRSGSGGARRLGSVGTTEDPPRQARPLGMGRRMADRLAWRRRAAMADDASASGRKRTRPCPPINGKVAAGSPYQQSQFRFGSGRSFPPWLLRWPGSLPSELDPIGSRGRSGPVEQAVMPSGRVECCKIADASVLLQPIDRLAHERFDNARRVRSSEVDRGQDSSPGDTRWSERYRRRAPRRGDGSAGPSGGQS
jgi:hypothetical protein